MKIYNLNGLSLGVGLSATYKEPHVTGIQYTYVRLLPSIDISITKSPYKSSSLFMDIKIGWLFFALRIHLDNYQFQNQVSHDT